MARGLLFIVVLFCFSKCYYAPTFPENKFAYVKPDYNRLALHISLDTAHFRLDSSTFNHFEAGQSFAQNNNTYFWFYDSKSESINFYEFYTGNAIKKVLLREYLKKQNLLSTHVYVLNFDTILVTDDVTMYLFDTSGSLKRAFSFVENIRYVKAAFENSFTPVFVNDKLYTGVSRHVVPWSRNESRRWRLIYEYDLAKAETRLKYHFPEIYQTNYWGRHYMFNSFCFNNKRKFVFSFAADSNIYETDLNNEHTAYLGKSGFQDAAISPVSEDVLKNDSDYMYFKLQGSYGGIYFDRYKKRYLRAYNHGMPDYMMKKGSARRSIILFDDHFKIIGESEIDKSVSLRQLFFTPNGYIYARVNAEDEFALHFVRLEYKELKADTLPLAKQEHKIIE